jgi:hypothetical protein
VRQLRGHVEPCKKRPFIALVRGNLGVVVDRPTCTTYQG